LGRRPPPAPPAAPTAAGALGCLLELPFSLAGAGAPPGRLVRHMAKDGLELVEHLCISSLYVVRQARPPELRDPAPAAHPHPARAASARDRGTCSARPRRGALPGCRVPDTRRTPRAARAAAPPPGAGRRTPAPR